MPAAAAVAAIVSPPELSLNEGQLWCELIERRCGIFFPETQWRHLRDAGDGRQLRRAGI